MKRFPETKRGRVTLRILNVKHGEVFIYLGNRYSLFLGYLVHSNVSRDRINELPVCIDKSTERLIVVKVIHRLCLMSDDLVVRFEEILRDFLRIGILIYHLYINYFLVADDRP